MRGRLNPFQRTMLLWDDMHAYNAVHAARVAAALDEDRLRKSLKLVLEKRGLAHCRISENGREFEFHDGAAEIDLVLISAGTDALGALRAEMQRQINLQFDRRRKFTPFRFFAVPDSSSGADSFWLGIAYFHAIADAEPVVRLAGEFVAAYASRGNEILSAEVAGNGSGARRDSSAKNRAGLGFRPLLWLRKLLALPAQFRAMRRAIRPGGTDSEDFGNGLELFTIEGGDLARLIAASKRLGVTVNDLFLALLMASLAPLGEAARRPGRDQISLGCIVNARRDLGVADSEDFDLVLGNFSVTCSLAETVSIALLARAIPRQTRRCKRGGFYLANTLEMSLVLRLMSLFSTNQRRRFYPKNYPLWGGLTNMNLTKIPTVAPAAAPRDYLRTVSTGPVTPLVLSVTTFGGAVNLALSYRTSVFPGAEISGVRERFCTAVRGLEFAV